METKWISIRDLNAPEIRFDQPLIDRIAEIANEPIAADVSNTFTNFTTYQRQVRETLSTSISVMPYFKGDGSYNDFKYRYFAGAFSDKLNYTPGNQSNIVATRYGLGIEIELKITQQTTALKGGFSMIAAAVQMGLASVDYVYNIYALPPNDYYTELPPMGHFDGEAIDKFKALVNKLKEAYKISATTVDLAPIDVLVASPVKDEGIQYTQAYYFAVKQILKGQSLKSAVMESRKSQKYNEAAILYIYSRVGVRSLDDIPNSQNQDAAKTLLNL